MPSRGQMWRHGANGLFYAALAVGYFVLIHERLKGKFQGDEWRYAFYAENLLKGYFSPPGVVFLENGPGYPLYLLPFRALEVHWNIARYSNAFLLVGAVFYFRRTLGLFCGPRTALAAAIGFAVYPPIWFYTNHLYTETLTTLLVLAFAYHYLRGVKDHHNGHLVAAGLLLGVLALTKMLFGTALVVWGGLAVLGFIIWRLPLFRRTALVALIALAVCVPYLAYTQHKTGRFFYWGSSMGYLLYFMSSPHPGHMGDAYTAGQVRKVKRLRRNHHKIVSKIARFDDVPKGSPVGKLHFLSSPEADDEFRRIAVDNIREHPYKYFQNWLANVSRMFLDRPFSYKAWRVDQPKIFAINGVLLFGVLVSLLMALWRRRSVDPAMLLLLTLAAIALGGNSLVATVARFSVPTLSILGLWTMHIFCRWRATTEAGAEVDDAAAPAT